jgi:phenylacetate-coenzyme A ligase PaaK-like adenylate-forming protein
VTGRKVPVTTLFNRSMPFIRYELSDLVAVADGDCACGRPHLRLASIEGRQQDVLSFPARRGGQVAINAFLLGETLLHVPAIRQYQLTPKKEGLYVRVVLRESASAKEALAAARHALEAELDRIGALPASLLVEAVPSIARSGGGAKANIVSVSP